MSAGVRHVGVRVQSLHTRVEPDYIQVRSAVGQTSGWMSLNKMPAGCGQIGRASPAGEDAPGERGGR